MGGTTRTEIKKICTGCGVISTGTRGSVADNTPSGWLAFVSHDRGFEVLCQKCSDVVEKHAKVILGIVNTSSVVFGSLPGIRRKRT